MHALIVGPRGVGKSTLIRRVLEALGRPVFGFETKKEEAMAAPLLGSPVYIHDAWSERFYAPKNLVGRCGSQGFSARKTAFDLYAPRLRRPIPAGGVVLLDELGFMESSSTEFCGAVLSLLDGDTPVLAAVKDKDFPFLNEVRAHPNCKCFYITQENRDALFPEVLAFLRAQFQKED